MQKIIFSLLGLISGVAIGYSIILYAPSPLAASVQQTDTTFSHIIPILPKRQIIGFLPYWLSDKAKNDYSKYITTLTYFGLAIDTDGTIMKMASLQEDEPGWYALTTGKMDPFFAVAKKQNLSLSLLIFSGNEDTIQSFLQNPRASAQNLIKNVSPIMEKYNFSDLNLDIESTQLASDDARSKFTTFVQETKKLLDAHHLGTLTIEVSPTDLIRSDLINPKAVGQIADTIVVMGYDYHFTGSYVTGPVAPLYGAGKTLEYDTQSAIQRSLTLMPASKVVLGIPLYGYEWETISSLPHAGVIPGTGIIYSNQRAESFLTSCATCSAQFDKESQETYVIYSDEQTGTYHQMAIPDQSATQAKVNFATQMHLGGIALWALGYEGDTILGPLANYK